MTYFTKFLAAPALALSLFALPASAAPVGAQMLSSLGQTAHADSGVTDVGYRGNRHGNRYGSRHRGNRYGHNRRHRGGAIIGGIVAGAIISEALRDNRRDSYRSRYY